MNPADASDHPPNPFHPTLAVAYFLAFAATLFRPSGFRVRPGGPFISISGDVLPGLMEVVAIGIALSLLWSNQLCIRLNAWFIVLIGLLALGMIYVDIYQFWIRPYARGDLIGL